MKEVVDSITILLLVLIMVCNSFDIKANKKEIEALKGLIDEKILTGHNIHDKD